MDEENGPAPRTAGADALLDVTNLAVTFGGEVEALRGVQQLLVGGDVLSVAHIQKALTALPNPELINGYGPTENTTFTCCYRIPRDFPGNRSVPIGKPIARRSASRITPSAGRP